MISSCDLFTVGELTTKHWFQIGLGLEHRAQAVVSSAGFVIRVDAARTGGDGGDNTQRCGVSHLEDGSGLADEAREDALIGRVPQDALERKKENERR